MGCCNCPKKKEVGDLVKQQSPENAQPKQLSIRVDTNQQNKIDEGSIKEQTSPVEVIKQEDNITIHQIKFTPIKEQHQDCIKQNPKSIDKIISPARTNKYKLTPLNQIKQQGLKKQRQKQQREQRLSPLIDDLVYKLYDKQLSYEEIKNFCEEKGATFTDVLLYTDNMQNSLIQIMANLDDFELFLQCFEQIEFENRNGNGDGDLIYAIQKRIFQKLERLQKNSPEQIHSIINTLKKLGILIKNKQLLNYVQITYQEDIKSQIEYDEIQYVYSKFNQDNQIQNRYHGNYLNLFNSLNVNLQKECKLFDFGSYANEFMVLMQRAHLSTINQFFEDYQLLNQIYSKQTNQGLNIIHCLCQNQSVNSSDYQLQRLLNQLSQCHKLDELLVQPYHDQVPLVYYLDNQKEINQMMINFLQKPFLEFTFNSRKINFQSQLLAQLFKVAKVKPFNQIQNWGPKLTQTQPPKKQTQSKCPKTTKNQHNQLNKDLQDYIEQLTDKFNQIYLYNVQVAKQLIKHKFQNLDFPWVKWDCPSTKLPTDFGGQQTGLISILIRNGFTDKANEEIQNIQEVEQDYELLELVNNQLKQLEILEIIQYCQYTQLASKLLVYLKELKSYPCQKLIIFIRNKVREMVQQQPQILCNQIIGNSIFVNNKYETLYTSLYLLQDQNLIGSCLYVEPIICQDKRIIHMILKNIMESKILVKINDPFEKALFNCIQLEGRLYLSQYAFCLNFQKPGERHQIQDHKDFILINIRTIFKINTIFINHEILKYIVTGHFYTQKLTFDIRYKVIQVICEQFEGAQQLGQIINDQNIGKKKYVCQVRSISSQINKIVWDKGIQIEQRLIGNENNQKLNIIFLSDPQQNQYQMIFKWLMAGYQFFFINCMIHPINFNYQQSVNYEQEIISEMLQQNLHFVQILRQRDRYFLYFEKYVQIIIKDNEINLLLDEEILIKMFENQAYQNIRLLIDVFDKQNSIYQCPQIIKILSIHYFGHPYLIKKQTHEYQLDPKSIQQFNENIQLLIQIIDQKPSQEYQQSYITNQNILIYLYPYITPQTLEKIGQQRLDLMIQNSNECLRVIHICSTQDQQIQLLNAYINVYKDNYEKLWPLRICFINNIPLFKICYIHFLNIKKDQFIKETVRITRRLILLKENDFVLEHLHKLKIKIDSNNLSIMYQLAYRQSNYRTLNFLLLYSEQNQIKFNQNSNASFYQYRDDFNYNKAIKQPYCVALSKEQYFQILKMHKIGQYTQQQRNDHFLQIIYAGQYEKLPLIIRYVNFDQYLMQRVCIIIWKFLNQYQINMNDWEQTEIENKRKTPNQRKYSKLKEPFVFESYTQQMDLPPNNEYAQHQSQTTIIFETLDDYSTNHLRCFQIIEKHILFENALEMLQLQFALLFPNKQVIKLSKELHNTIINLINNHNINITDYPFLIENLPKYIELLEINCKKLEFVEYLNADYHYLKQIIRAKIKDKNIVANVMIRLNYHDEKSIKFIRKYLTDYHEFLNDNALAYIYKNIKLIQQPRNLQNYRQFYNQYLTLKNYMEISTFDYKNVTPIQMYLIKGRPDFISVNCFFKQADLIAACLSNTWQSIEFILNSHPNPSLLGFEQNLFQTLIIYTNETCVLNYFNLFVVPYQLDINRLMYRDQTPMLYYVIHKKMSYFYDQFYIQYLTMQIGAENQRKILTLQLNSQPPQLFQTNRKLKLGQYALLCNFYEILDYFHLTSEDVQYIQSSRFLSKTNQFILYELNFGYICNMFCKLFALVRTQVFKQTYCELITLEQIKIKKEQKQNKTKLRQKIKKSQYQRSLITQELFELEKSILCILYQLDIDINIGKIFQRGYLNKLLFNQRNCQKILFQQKYYPELVIFYLQLQGIQVPEVDDDMTEAFLCIQNLRQNQNQKQNNRQILYEICNLCYLNYGSTHPVYQIAIQQQPEIFLLREFNDLILGNLELAILLFLQKVNKSDLQLFIIQAQAAVFKEDKEQLAYHQTVVNSLVLLNCIIKDEFQEDFLLKRSITQCQLNQILQILSHYQSIQNSESVTSAFQDLAFKFIEQIEFEDKYAVVNSIVSLYNGKLSKSIELLLHLLTIKDIVENFTCLVQKISLDVVSKFKFKITLQNKSISSYGKIFEIPIIFDKQQGQFILENGKIEEFVPQFKSQLFDMFINEDLQKKYQEIQNQYTEFNLDSLLLINPHDVQITNAEQMLQQIFFFKNLLEPQPQVGVYHVDDVLAPHQHEQVKPPELTLDNQQSQIIQSNNIKKAQFGRQISNQQQIKQDLQFMFELLPDNTYQVRQRKKQDQQELIFVEFYHFKLPKTIINLMKLNYEQYFRQYNGSNTISIIIQDFYKYSQYLTNLISDQQQDEWIVNLPYTMNDYKFIFQEQLLSVYNIPKILNKMNYFIENVKKNVGREEDTSIVQWRIQITSFLEVLVSKLVEIHNGDSQVLNMYAIIDDIFEWDTLIVILRQILYNTLAKAQQILKVIRGIYFEFNEVQNIFAPHDFASGLDTIFAFGNTTYLLYNHMLIVRLNVGLRQQSYPGQIETQVAKQRPQLSIFKQDNAVQQYIHSIINEYDFYTQIFTPEQLVSFLFDKLTVDREMLSISSQISKLINKKITLSVDHQGLARIFSPEIQNIKQAQTSERLKTYEEIWYILQRLSKYFKEDIFEYLKKQLTTDRFDEMFHIRLSTILEALKKGKPVFSITNSNERDISAKEKAVVLQKLCPLLPKSEIIISFQFGFQVLKNYYTNNSKLGDICTVCFCIDSKINNVNTMQLVYNSKGGELLFIKLDQRSDLLTKEQIIRQQNYYSNQKASNHEFQLVSIGDIHSVIVYQPNWPSDQIFNQSIVNVFFTDASGYLSISNEPKFLKRMVQIQLEQNKETKQELLDRLFGVRIVNVSSDLTLTSLTPIFPDQINFEFIKFGLLQEQILVASKHNVQISIQQNDFQVAPIKLAPISIACYFETSKNFQKITKQCQRFLTSNPELPNIKLMFDDDIISNVDICDLDFLVSRINVIESFQIAYLQFKQDNSGPKFTNSLQFMLGWDSLKFRKEQIIRQFIQKIEIHFVTQEVSEKIFDHICDYTELVVFENNTLQITCVQHNKLPCLYLLRFLYNLFLNVNENVLKQLIVPKGFEVQITKQYDDGSISRIVELIFLIDVLSRLMILKKITTKIQIISMKEIPEEAEQFKNEFYFFSSSVLYLVYNNYRDFSLEIFLVDYLNQSSIMQDKLYQYENIGPLIIKEACQIQFQPTSLNIKSDKLEASILSFEQEPKDFDQSVQISKISRQYLVLKVNGLYCQAQIIPSDEMSEELQQFMKQTTYKYQIRDIIYLLLNDLNYSIDVELQLKKVKIKFDQKTINLAQIMSQNFDIKAKVQFIREKCLLIKLYSDKPNQYKITSPYPIQIIFGEECKDLTITYINQQSQDLAQTQHVSLTLGKGKVIPVSNNNATIRFKNKYGDPKLMKILLKSAKKVDQETLIHKNYEGNEYQEDLQKGNTINMLSKQEIQSASRSGQGREDYIEFKDSLGNTVSNFTYETLIFVHTLYPQIQYKPNATRIKQGLQLQWQPVFKGIYKLFINDVRVQGKFIVLANIPSPSTSVVEIEPVNVVPFYEPIPISFLLKDKYYNICGDIEQQTFNDCICEILLIEGSTSKLQSSQKMITKFGQLNFTIHFEPKEIQAEEETELLFLVQKNQLKRLPIKISGISLEKRRNKFQTELNNSFKSCSYSLSIRRVSFLKDLLLLAEKKMNYSFSIKFVNEPGIDAGGLKREFYDMIGSTLKDDQYKFFTPVPTNLQKHFLSDHFNKLKDKQVFALLFGKLIANAIANTYIIGIDIVYPFWKVVYGEQDNFQDLKVIVDETTFRNLESIKLQPESIDILCLDFTYNSVDLIINGSNVAVTAENVDLYLDKVADYLIYQRYKAIYKSFIQGFDSVIDIKLFQKWLRPSEISLLTQGLSEIILSKCTYSNTVSRSFHDNQVLWERYLIQAEQKILRNIVKLITGSSTFSLNQSSFTLKIEFVLLNPQKKQPYVNKNQKSIKVYGYYSNYEEMKHYLDIAFTQKQAKGRFYKIQ